MKTIPPSELMIHADGSVFHLRLKPGQVSDRIVLVGDPERVAAVVGFFDTIECRAANREFHSVTGYYGGKRLTVVSHGIGGDNIDIVLTELDALVNIDFDTRTIRPHCQQLTFVRIGTCGSVQSFLPVGAWVASGQSVGFDGVPYFYAAHPAVRNRALEEEIIKQLDWQIDQVRPYAVSADTQLTEQIAGKDIPCGITISANGFYGAQGRTLRLPLADPELNRKIEKFTFNGRQKITNFEMESAALACLAAMMGHRALTVCAIIAGRVSEKVNTDYRPSLTGLIQTVLDRI